MIINLNKHRKTLGGIFFILLVIVFIIVASVIIVGLYKMSKKVNKPFKPKWDDVNWEQLDRQAESLALGGAEQGENNTEAHAYRRYILPGVKIWIFSSDSLIPPSSNSIAAAMAAEYNTNQTMTLSKQLDDSVTAIFKPDAKAGFKPMPKQMHTMDLGDDNEPESYIVLTTDEFETWTIPEPDPSVPSRWYHQYTEEIRPQDEEIVSGPTDSQFP